MTLVVDGDVIELSSDEDDVLLTKDEDSDVDPEDPNNAGNHINDALNIHDDFGRVLVNIGHPSDEPDIFLAPQIARYIKKHQVCLLALPSVDLIHNQMQSHPNRNNTPLKGTLHTTFMLYPVTEKIPFSIKLICLDAAILTLIQTFYKCKLIGRHKILERGMNQYLTIKLWEI